MLATILFSRFVHGPRQVHVDIAKWKLSYMIKSVVDYEILFKKEAKEQLIGYSDTDWEGSIDDVKDISGYAFILCSGKFSWYSKG